MRMSILGFLAFTLFTLFSCESKTEELDGHDYQPERLQELLPLQPGREFIYQLDSTVFTQLGLVKEVHVYQEKNVVDSPFTDNAGNPGFRLYRFLRDSAGTQPWQSAGSYFITYLPNRIETVEDNRRIVRLVTPVKEGYTWRGNQYLPDAPFSPFIENFSVGNALRTWVFSYGGVTTETIADTTINDIRTVFQIDEKTNLTETETPLKEDNYAARSLSLEKYAQNLGLVYQELLLWEYQPEEPGSTASYKGRYKGFGVKRTLIDHN